MAIKNIYDYNVQGKIKSTRNRSFKILVSNISSNDAGKRT